jgi:hypothetical protein
VVSGAFSSESNLSLPVVRAWNGVGWTELADSPGLAERLFDLSGALWGEFRADFGWDAAERTLYRWNGAAWVFEASIREDSSVVEIDDEIWATRREEFTEGALGEVVRLVDGAWQIAGGAGGRGKQLVGKLGGDIIAADRRFTYRLENDRWVMHGFLPANWYSLEFDASTVVSAHGGWYVSGFDSVGGSWPVVFWDGMRWSSLGEIADNVPGMTSSGWGPPLARLEEDVLVAGPILTGIRITDAAGLRYRAGASVARIRAGWTRQTPMPADEEVEAGGDVDIGESWPGFSFGVWIRNDWRIGDSRVPLPVRGATPSIGGLYTLGAPILERVVYAGSTAFQPATYSPPARLTVRLACDSIDFNNDGSSFDPVDIEAFLSVFSEGPCLPLGATCNDVDFNNDSIRFDPRDIDAFLRVFSGGACL